MELFRALKLKNFDLDFKSVFICGLLPALLNCRDWQPLVYLLLGLLKAFIWMLFTFLVWITSCSLFGRKKKKNKQKNKTKKTKKTKHKPQTMLSEQCFDLAGAHVKSNSYFVIVLKLLPFNGFKFAFFSLAWSMVKHLANTLHLLRGSSDQMD